jgi:Ca-activated chloride channel homolog
MPSPACWASPAAALLRGARSRCARIGLVALGVVLSGGPGGSAGQSAFRSGIEIVGLGVTVQDARGAYVTDLTAGDFEVREDGQRQTLSYFAQGTDDPRSAPLHLGMLFDTSDSMEEDLAFSRNAALRFLAAPTRAVDFTLVDFASEIRAARFTEDEFPRMAERIRRKPAKGLTALHDAIGVYLAGAFDQTGRKVLVIYTDGDDTSSAQSFEDTMDLLRTSDVTVYGIGFVQHTLPSRRLGFESRLRQMAEATGGRTFFPMTMRDLDEAYASVLAGIRARYDLGYVPTDQRRNGAWRRIRISVTRPDARRVTVRAKQGYFAPYEKPPRP